MRHVVMSLLAGVRSILRRVHLTHWRILRISIHWLSELWGGLSIHASSMLVVRLGRCYRGWRIRLRRVINGRIWALHVRSRRHLVGAFFVSVSRP
jgi:hypothetical protein